MGLRRMGIKDFHKKYRLINGGRSIKELALRWENEKAARDFLGTSVFGAVLLGDLVIDGKILDVASVPDEVLSAMKEIFPRKVSDLNDAVKFLVEKNANGDASVRGTINAIQGRLGEYQFQQSVGDMAELAEKSNQSFYDVKISPPGGEVNYVQVKVYGEASGAFDELEKLNQALLDEKIVDSGKVVKKISFAVNDDILSEVQTKAESLGSNIEVRAIGADYETIRSTASDAVTDHASYLDNFFEDLFGGVVVGAALHGAVNGFLYYKGHKCLASALEDTAYSTAVSGGGIAASLCALRLLGIAGGPVGFCLSLGVGIGSRAVLKRVGDRRHIAKKIDEQNEQILRLSGRLSKLA